MTYTVSSFMDMALAEARDAAARGEVPVGAVLTAPASLLPGAKSDGSRGILAQAGNRVEELKDVTAHAEMLVLRNGAAIIGATRLPECDLYVTLEPCPMCAAAMGFARVRRLYYGAADPKGGGVEHGPRIFHQPTCHHRPEIYPDIAAAPAAKLLRNFFAARR